MGVRGRVYGYVFARGGSKGIPGKNIALVAGRPLLAYAVESLRESQFVDRIIVSTDDATIAETARACGAEVPFMRPAELASDQAPELDAWKHALRHAEREGTMPAVFVSAPATSPLREACDLDRAIDLLVATCCDLVVAVVPSSRNPYFNMVSRTEDGRTQTLLRTDPPLYRRQDAPPVYDLTTVVYAARPQYVLRCQNLFEGDVRSIVIPTERSLDIDTPFDLAMAEVILRKKVQVCPI